MNEATRSYAVVTASYWGFTLTDGALRMLVLLHFHALGYQPLDLAFLFLLYEFMGIITNLAGGWLGARFGLKLTLFSGLGLQVAALAMLAMLPASLTITGSVIYVMASQALSGVAKDLTKMSSKSAVKTVVPAGDESRLFRWVSLLTGSKNALKGAGFFLGGFLLATLGFQAALFTMAGGLALILMGCAFMLRRDIGKASGKVKFTRIFSNSGEVNWLSAARIFLFASRDVWFVVGLPVYLASTLGWSHAGIGGFMALWIIGYGTVQAAAPGLLKGSADLERAARSARIWGALLGLIPIAIELGLEQFGSTLLIGGLILFGVLFAINSALHSYLIVGHAHQDGASLAIGFYYMANAVGRLTGTLLSGLVYQYYGLTACLIVSSAMIIAAVLLTLPLGEKDKMRTR